MKKYIVTSILILVALIGSAQTKDKKHKPVEQYYIISAISETGKTAIGIYKITWEPNINDCKLIMGKQLGLDSSKINVMAVYPTTKSQFIHFNDKASVTFTK